MSEDFVDVLIVGAGLSGIGAACRLAVEHPGRSVAILEARQVSGGTWDLFRYPGIRSDSDMLTLGYRFRPWTAGRALADGGSILRYLRETAQEYGVDRLVRYGHRVVSAEWDTATARWAVTAETPKGPVRIGCRLLWFCTGYFDYDAGHTPDLPGIERFGGRVVHAQSWPADVDTAGKRVVVIGSGATAVTLVPALARTARQVTMLQRSPSYVLSLPNTAPLDAWLRRLLPRAAAYQVSRWRSIGLQAGFYRLSRRRPRLVRALIRRHSRRRLPPGYPVDVHFRPRYDPWTQRLCVVPQGDLFRVLSEGAAEVVTGSIRSFTAEGPVLESGQQLTADVMVLATGLRLLPFGGIRLVVDASEIEPGRTMAYRAMMLAGVPNLVFSLGYGHLSWTLKVDLVADWTCRLLRYLDAHGHAYAVPEPDPAVEPRPLLELTSGYVLRALDRFPVQGAHEPWRLTRGYLGDRRLLRRGRLDDGVLRFG